MDKSRIVAQLDILEKLLNGKNSFKTKEDEVVNFRNLTAKILNLLEGSEHVYRDTIIRNPSQLDAIVMALQANIDSQVAFNLVKIISELVGKTNSQKKAQALVHHGASKALLQCIYLESKENNPCEEYLFLLHEVLYRVAIKDKKIGVRARLSQCLPVVVNLLRSQVNLVPHNRNAINNAAISSTVSRNIVNLLHVLRLYSQNLINASRLGRNGLIGLLLKITSYAGKNNLSILKITLEITNLCVRTKSNGARAVNQGAMAMLLQLFLDWNRIDSRDKQLPLRRSILSVVKNLINLRAGRKAFLEADGLHTFYGFCEAYKFQNTVDSIVTLVSLILRKCFPKNRLPLSHYDSTLQCPLPSSSQREKSRYLLDLRKSMVSPGAPRSTSPIDALPLFPLLGCQGDDSLSARRRFINRDKSLESFRFNQDSITEDSVDLDTSKDGNRLRARNLFRSLDRKLSETSRKNVGLYNHQNYIGRYSINPNSSQQDKKIQPSMLMENEDDLSPDQEAFDNKDEKDEQEEQSLVEQILMNGSCYQPPDDRSFDKLKDSYQRFLFERDFFKNDSRRRSSPESQDDSSDRTIKPNEITRSSGDAKRSRETMQPSLLSLQINAMSSVRRLSRGTFPKNEVIISRAVEAGDDKSPNLICTGIGMQRSGPSITQVQGLYQRSKRSSITNKPETIDIKTSINDLTTSAEKSSVQSKKIVEDNTPSFHTREEFMETYIKISSVVTKSLGRFSMIGYPDLFEQSFVMKSPEPLTETFIQNQIISSSDGSQKSTENSSKRGQTSSLAQNKKPSPSSKPLNSQRPQSSSPNADNLAQNKILDDLRRIIDSEDIIEKVVYDLDNVVNENFATYNVDGSNHTNSDELELDKLNPLICSHLQFDSQFESGNLRKVIQIRQFEYDLILSPDVNTNHHTQWFYFRVSAMEAGVPYRFNIINCEKPNSQFNFGMQPLLFSVKEALKGRGYWKRSGSEIFYYKNHFARSAATCGGNIGKSYFTCTFLMEFPNSGDVCYMAYHYPYTYTRLLTDISMWTRRVKSSKLDESIDAEGDSKEKTFTHDIVFQSLPEHGILFSVQELCKTILKNPVPLITITNWPKESGDRQGNKPYVFLSSRVHPGESNASWVIKGCIDFLLSDSPIASQLRDTYIFKIVPMLNPDGVINGCHRCSMAGQDLNRRWLDPCEMLNPTIYHTKGLIMLLAKLGQAPVVYCDFHGHSRRKNVFMFGCSPLMSWISDDANNPAYVDQKTEDQSYYVLPNALNKISQQFSIDCCSFAVEKVKEATARVVVWRQFGVKRSYTMESSYCSCDQGTYKNLHINVPMLEDMGSRFAEALLYIEESVQTPVCRSATSPATNSSTTSTDRKMSFKYDYSQSSDSKCQTISVSRKHNTDNDSNVDSGGCKFVENDDDEDEETLSENEEDNADESDKDEEYNNEEDVEDSD